ncbi:glycoside hydrolase superfamily [Coniella lustricola]|uniref:Glycoside hydrolase superfamily n=1 Tax=Coniella lustricola TaxID=2025994 RepID=A0A2T2ZSA0_9PEZI|nr:glycoside hydrolase superfamily [Coniella lustricola]
MDSVRGIAWGWLPDDANPDVTMASLNAKTGKRACFYGDYSKIKSASSYTGADITSKASTAAAAAAKAGGGLIVVPSIMPVGVSWREVTTGLADKIGTVVEAFTNKGLVVYLRFAHEMNCYAKPGCATPAYPGGEDYTGFRQAWRNVANVCHGIQGCYMMWSPNLQDVASMYHWWPGAEYVDVVAVDHYPQSDDEVDEGFGGAYGEFYKTVVEPYGKPFMLGETAYGGSTAMKDQWVREIADEDFGDYPLYKGAMWFE